MQGLKTKWKWVLAIIAMQFITMGTVGIAPALAQIGAAFPERSAEEVQLLMSLPSLGTVIASLIAVAVAAKIGRKKSIVAGLVIFCITGLIPCFVENWFIILLSRFGIGFGCGFVNPLNTAAIFALFDKQEERDTLLGWQQIGNDIGYIIMALACGYLTLLGWRWAFAVHAVGIISLILTIIFFPSDSKQIAVAQTVNEEKKPAGKMHMTGAAIFWLIFVLVFEGTLHTFSMNISYLVTETGAGDSVLSGYASTLMTVGGAIIGLFFGKFSKYLKRWTLGVGVLIDVIAFVCLMFVSASGGVFALVGGFLVGFGMVIVFSTTTAFCMTSVNEATHNLVSSLFIICINAGQFLNPYWGSFLGNILGGGDGSAHSKVVGSMIILAVCCVVALFAAGKVGGKVKEPAEA